jgi:NAD(P)H-hydrate epimerase
VTVPPELLTVAECAAVDRAALASGLDLAGLIERAGRAVAAGVRVRWTPRPVAVLCGPGNNGADGLVAARALARAGWPVRVGRLGVGGADHEPLAPAILDGAALVVDALFGAGLARPLRGTAAEVLAAARDRGLPSVAVDVPSGVTGDGGEAWGPVLPAALTVTFVRRKPGHLLEPGRSLCGEIVVADIGIPEPVVASVPAKARANDPGVWERALTFAGPGDHKHSRGHVVVAGGGPAASGAARLAAAAALRAGAGLVTTAVRTEALAVHAAHQTAVMVALAETAVDFAALLGDLGVDSVLVGPGAGVTPDTRERVLAALDSGRPCVLDADALTVFRDAPRALFDKLAPTCLLTPHEGEFRRLFAITGDKLSRARAAAATARAVVLIKGSDTVIAAPDGRALIAGDAPPWLATAGSGDVLAGLAAGLMAQGVPAFEAAGAACWLHATAARACGPGSTSEDLVAAVPGAVARLRARRHGHDR